MNRRKLLTSLLYATGAVAVAPLLPVRLGAAQQTDPTTAEEFPPVNITREQWQEILPPDRYRILFREGTEPAGSSPLDKVYDPGTYICAACFLPLFDSEDKFDSGTGWPSFTRPIEGRMGTKTDWKLILPRTEYHCIRCGGHQGHVFDDGPPPTGQRWCNNGLALRFVPEGEELPELRTSA
jgi:peptide-methionine (R)-S-oxide reductase